MFLFEWMAIINNNDQC